MLLCASASVVTGVIVASVAQVTFPLWSGIVGMALACGGIAAFSIIRERDPLAPALLMSLVLFALYVLRPLYVLSANRIGPTRAADDQAVTPAVHDAMARASGIALLGVLAFGVGYILRATSGRPADAAALRTRMRNLVLDVSYPRFYATIVGAGLVALYAYWRLIAGAGGFHAYLDQLSVRSGFFFGRAYLTDVAIPFKVAVLALLAVQLVRQSWSRRASFFAGGLIAVALIGDFLTGGRAAILLGTALPVTVLVHYLRRRLSIAVLIPLALCGVLVFVAARVITRDAVYAHESRTTAVASAFRDLPAQTVGAREAVPFDSLVVLVNRREDQQLPLQLGRTYTSIPSFVVPRAVWPSKPIGGGNAWFTSRYFPVYYGTERIETSLSFVGESYANFGTTGVIALMFLLGLALAKLYRWLLGGDHVWRVLIYALILGEVFQLLRGDAFHAVTTFEVVLVATGAVLLAVSRAALARSGHPIRPHFRLDSSPELR